MPIERNSSEQLPSSRQKREQLRRQSRIDGRTEADTTNPWRHRCGNGYMKHFWVWEVFIGFWFVIYVVGLINDASDGVLFIGTADIGIYVGGFIFIAPVGALISWSTNRALRSLFGSKDIM